MICLNYVNDFFNKENFFKKEKSLLEIYEIKR